MAGAELHAMPRCRNCKAHPLTICEIYTLQGVSIGYQFRVSTGDAVFGDVVVTTLSLKPLIFSIDPLLTDAEVL
eukprot:SAG31_NODE_608_length_13576_cov_23.757290_5_plen_74_part_00